MNFLKVKHSARVIYLIIALLILVSTLNYFTVLRNKFPYSSDTLFFVHMYYQFKGNTFTTARDSVLKNYPIKWNNIIEENIFASKKAYIDSYPFFKHRIFYPLTAFVLGYFIHDELMVFLLPLLFSYIGLALIIFKLFRPNLGLFLAAASSMAFIYFPLNVLTATTFSADMLGVFLFFLTFVFILNYIKSPKPHNLLLIAVLFSISCLNREQSLVLMPILVSSLIIFLRQKNTKILKSFKKILLVVIVVGFAFYGFILVDGQPTLVDSYHRFMNGYGLTNNSFTLGQTFKYYRISLWRTHVNALAFLESHILVSCLVLVAIYESFKKAYENKLDEVEVFLLTTSIFTYLLIFAVPSFEPRYFIPITITVIYFTAHYLKRVFKLNETSV